MSNKKNWSLSYKIKISLVALGIIAGIGAIGGFSYGIIQKQNSLNNQTLKYNKEDLKQNALLNDGESFTPNQLIFRITDKFNQKMPITFASEYASENRILSPVISGSYWREQLLFGSSTRKSKIDQNSFKDRDFALLSNKGVALNYFIPGYNLVFSSYSNDLEGKLFLRIKFIPKQNNSTYKVQFDEIYEISGFQKFDFSQYQKNMSIDDHINLNFSALETYSSFDDLAKSYKAGSNEEKIQISKSILEFTTSKSATVNWENTILEFDKNKKEINTIPYLNPVVNAASFDIDKLSDTKVINTSETLLKTYQLNVSLEEYFKIKTTWIKNLELVAKEKELSDLNLEDIKKSYDSITQMFTVLKLNGVQDGYQVKFSDKITIEDDKYKFF